MQVLQKRKRKFKKKNYSEATKATNKNTNYLNLNQISSIKREKIMKLKQKFSIVNRDKQRILRVNKLLKKNIRLQQNRIIQKDKKI